MAMLEEEAAHSECATCGAMVDDDWVACPSCGTELAVRCVSCGRPLELDWRICAWCAAEVPWDGEGRPIRPAVPREAVAIAIRPGGRRCSRCMAAPEDEDEAVGPPRPSSDDVPPSTRRNKNAARPGRGPDRAA